MPAGRAIRHVGMVSCTRESSRTAVSSPFRATVLLRYCPVLGSHHMHQCITTGSRGLQYRTSGAQLRRGRKYHHQLMSNKIRHRHYVTRHQNSNSFRISSEVRNSEFSASLPRWFMIQNFKLPARVEWHVRTECTTCVYDFLRLRWLFNPPCTSTCISSVDPSTVLQSTSNLWHEQKVEDSMSRRMTYGRCELHHTRMYRVPPKHLTLDRMQTSDFSFRKACYQLSSKRRKLKTIKIVEKLEICIFGSVYFWYKVRPKKSYGTCKNRSEVSFWSKVRRFYGTQTRWITILKMVDHSQKLATYLSLRILDEKIICISACCWCHISKTFDYQLTSDMKETTYWLHSVRRWIFTWPYNEVINLTREHTTSTKQDKSMFV